MNYLHDSIMIHHLDLKIVFYTFGNFSNWLILPSLKNCSAILVSISIQFYEIFIETTLKFLVSIAIQFSEIFIESTLKFSHLCVLNYLDSAIAETAILVFISI